MQRRAMAGGLGRVLWDTVAKAAMVAGGPRSSACFCFSHYAGFIRRVGIASARPVITTARGSATSSASVTSAEAMLAKAADDIMRKRLQPPTDFPAVPALYSVAVGDVLDGRASHTASYGLWVDVEAPRPQRFHGDTKPGIELLRGLVHLSEMDTSVTSSPLSDSRSPPMPLTGSRVRVRVTRVDPSSGQLALSMRLTQGLVAAASIDAFRGVFACEWLPGTVRHVTAAGVVVDVEAPPVRQGSRSTVSIRGLVTPDRVGLGVLRDDAAGIDAAGVMSTRYRHGGGRSSNGVVSEEEVAYAARIAAWTCAAAAHFRPGTPVHVRLLATVGSGACEEMDGLAALSMLGDAQAIKDDLERQLGALRDNAK
eukprot:TRINITY_DN34365_c0_g1_i1.p1 TRINITY_DN34365_c0_g1~~TRINITY_DN34365_c0_g1_i1.p1  ORF type:complete len:368 (+),score=69.34 TRINITY_DN34365_c0_g1_i1:136-1239(+)